MKIAIRGGHNYQAVGASALIDEVTEDRKVKDAVVKYLLTAGCEVLDVTPGDCDASTDLACGVNKANNWGADYFISIHFNKAYGNYDGALGTEAWIIGTGGKSEPIAKRIVEKIASLGFEDRGVKESPELYELRKTNMPAIIVEVCFVEATEDVRIYKEKGPDLVGKVIAEGICNQSLSIAQIQSIAPGNDQDVNLLVWVRASKAESVTRQIISMGYACQQLPIPLDKIK